MIKKIKEMFNSVSDMTMLAAAIVVLVSYYERKSGNNIEDLFKKMKDGTGNG